MRQTLLFILLIFIIICGCKREYGSYYDPPIGQESYIYKQLVSDPRFSTFVSAIDKVPGLKNELSSSGLFTVMAPDNEAFLKFFESHPTYKLDVIPVDRLVLIVKYHIMKWMLFQVNFLKPGLTKDVFTTFKYESRANLSYSEPTYGGTKAIYCPSKMLQIYTPNFFNLYRVTAQDYRDVYGAGSSIAVESKINVMGATVTKQDIASGNGVIHVIDKVLLPPLNVAQLLGNDSKYNEFFQLMKKRFLTYTYNASATLAQGNYGDVNGNGMIDSLWNRVFTFNSYIDDENPKKADKSPFLMTAFGPPKSNFSNYLHNKLAPGFSNNIDSIPNRTLSLLYQSYFSNDMYWPSQIDAGIARNLLSNTITLSRSDINNIRMTSNSIFYELNKVLEPDAFTAVTGPAFLASNYWYFAEMLIQTGILSSLTKEGTKYTILCPTNRAFVNAGIYYDQKPSGSLKPGFFKLEADKTVSQLTIPKLVNLMGNHIIPNYDLSASRLADGFYLTLNTSPIVIEGGKIYGSVRDSVSQITDPDKHMSNGYFHGISKIIIDPQQSIYNIINSASLWNATSPLIRPEYTKFKELCVAAGILAKDFVSITKVDEGNKFTLFVPSNEAIIAAQTQAVNPLPKTGAVTPNEPNTSGVINDLTKRAKLENYIRYFFVQGRQALTNGNVTGTYFTSKKDQKSTPTDPVYIPVSITFPGGILTLNEVGGTSSTGKVIMTNLVLYPQNTIAKDGIIQIIDNAFTSKY
jgi:uncharacterized surface protein with fasciclin (FAS1) repeats